MSEISSPKNDLDLCDRDRPTVPTPIVGARLSVLQNNEPLQLCAADSLGSSLGSRCPISVFSVSFTSYSMTAVFVETSWPVRVDSVQNTQLARNTKPGDEMYVYNHDHTERYNLYQIKWTKVIYS